MKKEELDFGSYVKIEQKRFGVPNEMYLYKVIGRMGSNHYVDVPVKAGSEQTLHEGGVVPVVACICCGIDETKVQKFRLADVNLAE